MPKLTVKLFYMRQCDTDKRPQINEAEGARKSRLTQHLRQTAMKTGAKKMAYLQK